MNFIDKLTEMYQICLSQRKKFKKATVGKHCDEMQCLQNILFLFIEEPILENHDRITVYYNGTFEGQENPTFISISSLMQENQIELVPVVMLAEPEFMYCANSRKMISVCWKIQMMMIYAFILLHHVCILLPIIANQNCILSDTNSVGFRLGFSKILSNLNTSDELEISNKSNRLLKKCILNKKCKSTVL